MKIFAALVAGVLGLTLLSTSPAQAGTIVYYAYARTAGMPAASEPARTITQVDANVTASSTNRLSMQVQLGAAPDATTDDTLTLVFGTTAGDGSCTPAWTDSFSTVAPGDHAARDGSTISVERVIDAGVESWDCSTVTLTSGGSTTDDAYLGHPESALSFDAYGFAKIVRVGHRQLRAGHWSFVTVLVRNKGYELTRLRVTGHGDRLDTKPVVVHGIIAHGQEVKVRLPVRLRGERPTTLRVTTRPYGDLYLVRRDHMYVRVRPN